MAARRSQRPRVIVVAKRSALSRLRDGEGEPRARELLKAGHATVKKWVPAHDQHVRSLDRVLGCLEDLGVESLVLHGSHARFQTTGAQLVITVGGDGTLLAASHSVSDVPILGVNSAPDFSVGYFCAAKGARLERTIARALEGDIHAASLSRMGVKIGGQIRSERVLNEALFCHTNPAATSKYILRVGRRREEQRSSGIWIGPAAGSTGAMRSAGGKVLPLDSRQLQLVVREPYLPDGGTCRLSRELIGERATVSVWSKIQSGKLFLDGPYQRLDVPIGEEVTFFSGSQPLTVLGLRRRRG